MVGITRSKIIFKDGGRRIHDDNPKFVALLQFSNWNSVLTLCAFPRNKMPEYDHLFQTTQQQVDSLCIFLVARVLLGYGLALPNPISKIPFDVDGTGACKPKSRAWTIGSLLGKLKCNWWPQDRTTVAAKEVLQANPGQYFTNLYLMILMSTEAFAKTLGQRLWKHIFQRFSAFFVSRKPLFGAFLFGLATVLHMQVPRCLWRKNIEKNRLRDWLLPCASGRLFLKGHDIPECYAQLHQKNYLNWLPSKKSRTWFRSTHADPGPKIPLANAKQRRLVLVI